MTDPTPLTTGGEYLKRGYTSDPEDHRMTHRLREARAMLKAAGFEPTKTHKGLYADEPQFFEFHVREFCGDQCRTTWPETLTNEAFNAVFAAADAIQNARHAETTRAVNRRFQQRMDNGTVVA